MSNNQDLVFAPAVNVVTASSSSESRMKVCNLGFPSRPSCYAPWAPQLVFKPTTSPYQAVYSYGNGASGATATIHQPQTNTADGTFVSDALKWVKRVLKRRAARLRRQLKIIKLKFANAHRPPTH